MTTKTHTDPAHAPAEAKPRFDVSVAIACYNAVEYLEAAVTSALAQNGVSLEVLIVDDHSTDGSLALAHDLASLDSRIRVMQTPENGGPAAARNVALVEMRGDWFAVLDSDDLFEPGRLRRLLDVAERTDADFVADDLRVFGEDVDTHAMVGDHAPLADGWISLETYLDRSRMFAETVALGYLKPVIRASVIREMGLRYNTEMRIGEDDDLVLQLLSANKRYRFVPEPLYRYRKHDASISHRLSVDHAQRMLTAEADIRARIGPDIARSQPYRRRWAAMVRGLAFVRSVDMVKRRRFGAALATLLRHPSAILLYKMPIEAALRRRLGKRSNA